MKYTQTLVMDGNFKAKHMQKKCPDNQTWLMDDLRYMVTQSDYQAYLKVTNHPIEVMDISEGRVHLIIDV